MVNDIEISICIVLVNKPDIVIDRGFGIPYTIELHDVLDTIRPKFPQLIIF